MNEYQNKLIKDSETLSGRQIVLRILSVCLFPMVLGLGYIFSDYLNRMGHGFLDLWMIIYMLLTLASGIYLIFVTLLCKGIFLFYDKVVPLMNGYVNDAYLAPEIKVEALKQITKMKYAVNSMLVKFLKNGCLGKSVLLRMIERYLCFGLFLALVSFGYVWTGVFFGFSAFLAIYGASSFRGMIYANVYRLEDTLGGSPDLDDLSDKLFNGGR